MKAFTIAFYNDRFDESAAAAQFAANEQLDIVVRIGPGDLAPVFERSIWHSEIAVANSHGVARLMLSEVARRHVKVVLTARAPTSRRRLQRVGHLTLRPNIGFPANPESTH